MSWWVARSRRSLVVVQALGVLLIAVIACVLATSAHAAVSPNPYGYPDPTTTSNDAGTKSTMSQKFSSAAADTVVGVGWWRAAAQQACVSVYLTTVGGSVLASNVGTACDNSGAAGWAESRFSSPVSIAAGTTYEVTFFTANGYDGRTVSGLNSAQTYAGVTFPASGAFYCHTCADGVVATTSASTHDFYGVVPITGTQAATGVASAGPSGSSVAPPGSSSSSTATAGSTATVTATATTTVTATTTATVTASAGATVTATATVTASASPGAGGGTVSIDPDQFGTVIVGLCFIIIPVGITAFRGRR